MTRLSRTLMGAALVLGLTTTARAAEPDKLLPADTDTVAVVNLRQIIDSDIIKKYALEQIKQLLDGQDAKQILTDLGLDPLKDVEKVVIGSVEPHWFAGVTGALWLSLYASVDAIAGVGYEFQVIAAVVVGGVAIFGGSGTVLGAALGALLLYTINSALVVVNVSSFWSMALS